MLEIHERLSGPTTAQATLTLPFELRQRSRLLTRLDNGEEVGLFLPRGTVLRQDDLLRSSCGLVIKVNAALETVSKARAHDALQLAKACYHLGNRHVPLQIGNGWVRYLQDHVLDRMVAELGLAVAHQQAPFEPETGAYHSH